MAFSVRFQQLHPHPDLGPLKHDHKLTLIFFSLPESDLPNPWIKRGDPSVIWPRDWLPKEEEGLGNNILVLSVQCFVASETQFLKPLEEILVRDLVMKTKWGLNRAQTVVLVGYGLGGVVMKSLIIEVHELSKSKDSHGESQGARCKACKAFEQNIKSIVFYSVPPTTSWEEFVNNKSYTMMIQYVDKVRGMVFLNERFEKSIAQHINLFAFVERQKVMVPQSSTYKLVKDNVCEIEDAEHFQVSQPLDQQHVSYKRLLQLIQENLAQTQMLDAMIRTIDVRINFPWDLLSLAPKEVLGKTSIVCVGGKAMEGDSVEFLFRHAGDMAKVVGVGLDWAKVVVTKEFGVNVVQEDEGIWTKLWCLEHFVPRIITIPNPEQELLTHPSSAKTDGVELEANLGHVYVEDEKEENAHACFPLVFELAKHVGFGREKAMKMKEVSGEGSSGSTKDGVNNRRQLKRNVFATSSGSRQEGGEVSGAESSGPTKGGEVSGAESSGPTKGGEVSGAESSGSTKGGEVSKSSGSTQEPRRNEDDEESKDPSRDPPNNSDPSLSVGPQDEEKRTLIVTVHPKKGEFHPLWEGQTQPPSICPKLIFEFQKEGKHRVIMSTTETSCNFGEMEDEATGNGFCFYQDNITISLRCEDPDAAGVTNPRVKDVENVKKTMINTSTKKKNSGHQGGCGIGGSLMASHFHESSLNAQTTYGHTRSGGTNFTQGSNHEDSFVQLGCYHVNNRCMPENLRYNFQYPQHDLQQIASSDLSEIKTENTFWATIMGDWDDLNEKMSLYVFSVKQYIVSKEKLRGSKKEIANSPHTPIEYKVRYDWRTKQCYEVALKVNHGMKHIPPKVNTESLSVRNNILKIEDVMEMLPSTPT